jgi:hypothetical protein
VTRASARTAIRLLMLAIGLLLGVDLMYVLNGSLEQFPTGDDVGRARLTAALLGLLLVALEVGLWRLLRHLARRDER